MKLNKLFLCTTLLLAAVSQLTLGAATFNPNRDYFTYTHGDGKVTLKLSNHGNKHIHYPLDNINLYQIKGEGADVNNNESDDLKMPIKHQSSHSITWQITENDNYYIDLQSNSRSAFGSDFVSCYLELHSDENSRMNLDVNEII